MQPVKGGTRRPVRSFILYREEDGWPIRRVFAHWQHGMFHLKRCRAALLSFAHTWASASTLIACISRKMVVPSARQLMMALSMPGVIGVMYAFLRGKSDKIILNQGEETVAATAG